MSGTCARFIRERLIEAVADFDDDLALGKYLEGEVIDAEELMQGISKATLLLGLSESFRELPFKNRGVQRLLDAVIEILPSPLDVPAMKGVDSNGRCRFGCSDDHATGRGLGV
jgi:elongation factor G